MYEYWSHVLVSPALEVCTDLVMQSSRSRFWSIPSWAGVDSDGLKKTFHFEMDLPSVLFLNQNETVMCSLKRFLGGGDGQEHERFHITTLELILKSRWKRRDHFEILQRVATTTTRPDIELLANGHPFSLPQVRRDECSSVIVRLSGSRGLPGFHAGCQINIETCEKRAPISAQRISSCRHI